MDEKNLEALQIKIDFARQPAFTVAAKTLKVSGKGETAGRSSISMIRNELI